MHYGTSFFGCRNGDTLTRYAIASGTRRRAEFPIYSALAGTFVFTVDNITCGSTYTYNGHDSVSINIGSSSTPAPTPGGSPGGGCTTNCASVSSIIMIEKPTVVRAVVKAIDENGSNVQGATVEATWNTPSSGSPTASGTTTNKGEVVFKTPKDTSGNYTLTINGVTSASGLTYDPDTLSNSITV
jgi:hypothetical protein